MWCIANPLAKSDRLAADIKDLCTKVNCSSIEEGGSCYEPNQLSNHASVVFNLYFKAHESKGSACDFGGDALITFTDPCELQTNIMQFSTII